MNGAKKMEKKLSIRTSQDYLYRTWQEINGQVFVKETKKSSRFSLFLSAWLSKVARLRAFTAVEAYCYIAKI